MELLINCNDSKINNLQGLAAGVPCPSAGLQVPFEEKNIPYEISCKLCIKANTTHSFISFPNNKFHEIKVASNIPIINCASSKCI